MEAASPRFIVPAAVFLATFVCFQPATMAGFVDWDDQYLILQNPHYRGLTGENLSWMFTTFHMGHYQPLTWVTLAVDYHLWGMRPAGYHLVSMLLHATNALLVYFLILALLQLADVRGRLAAAAGALLWSVHPLRVESVAWVTERRDVLSALFLLLALLAYLRMCRDPAGRARWLALSLACYVLSLLSKAWGMTLPVVLLILDVYPLGRWQTDRRRVILEKLPYLALGAAAAVVAALAQTSAHATVSLERHTVTERLLQVPYGLAFYVWKTLVPVHLSPLYLLDRRLELGDARFLGPAVLVVAATVWIVAQRRRWPWALCAWLCYGVVVAPVLGAFQSGTQLAADRYTYLAILPGSVLVAAALLRLAPRPAAAAAGAAILVLGVATFFQTRIWRSTFALWDHAVSCNPQNYAALVNRGVARFKAGDADAAIGDIGAAIAITPRFAHAYAMRGAVKVMGGRIKEAMSDFDEALRLNPGLAEAYVGRANARLVLRDAAGAMREAEEAVRLAPELPDGYVCRAIARRASGDLRGALEDFDAALRLGKFTAEVNTNRGAARMEAGDLDGAMRDFNAALECDPGHVLAYQGRGDVHVRAGRIRAAIAEYERALLAAPPGWPGRSDIERHLEAARRAAPK